MSYVEDLLEAYRRSVAVSWQQNLGAAQRVWMAVYPPQHERRVRLHVRDFQVATEKAGHAWALIDITGSFERWMADHDYREEYFAAPHLLPPGLPAFFDYLALTVREQLGGASNPNGVAGLLGAGTLFGLSDAVKVSALLNAVNDAIAGRLLVFFPGEHEGNVYRLLDARDGWDYLAMPIKPDGSRR